MGTTTRAQLLRYVLLGVVVPVSAAHAALWHAGVMPDGSIVLTTLPIMAVAMLGAAGVKSSRMEDGRMRRWYTAVVAGQAAGLVVALGAVDVSGDTAPLWGVAVVSLVMLAVWAFAVRARAAREPWWAEAARLPPAGHEGRSVRDVGWRHAAAELDHARDIASPRPDRGDGRVPAPGVVGGVADGRVRGTHG